MPGQEGTAARGTVEPPARPEREGYLDLWRALALGRVVLYHTTGWVWLTIVFPAMGLMLGLAASLMVKSLDRGGLRSLGSRLRRLLPSLWVFGLVAVPVMLLNGWRVPPTGPLGWGELVFWIVPAQVPPVGGPPWAWAFNISLWYLVTYLWLVTLSPVLLVVFRRWPKLTLAVATTLPLLYALIGSDLPGYFIITYAPCWLIGFAHRDGLLRRVPRRRYVAALAVLAAVGLIWWYVNNSLLPAGQVDDALAANPWWSLAVVAAVLRFQPRTDRLTRVRSIDRALRLINARAVTIYLWHLPAGTLVGILLLSVTPGDSTVRLILRLAGTVVLTMVAIALFGWVEDLAAGRGRADRAARAYDTGLRHRRPVPTTPEPPRDADRIPRHAVDQPS
ncbi:acyltransferase [Micromonospora sp. NPDC050417]|uniref:acyltransferase n=1 Tax=Micromonospora sp. NPDC050417 TaxID=3364280 RepID=UPI003791AF9F